MDNKNVFNDRMIKLIGIPVLGLFIPNVSGLITNHLYTYPELLANYTYFTLLSFIVSLPGIAAFIWLFVQVRSNEKRRRHDRELISRNSRRVNAHERSLAKMEGRDPLFLHPIYDDTDEEEAPFD